MEKRETIPPVRESSPRRRILAALREAEAPLSALEISALAGIAEKDVRAHLEHIAKSLRARGERLRIVPSTCHSCGFVFAKRDRTTKPGKCPVCGGGRLSEPLFSL